MKNFAILIPKDIARHSDGTPISFIKPEHKELVRLYILENGVTNESWMSMQGKEKEILINEAKKKLNIQQ